MERTEEIDRILKRFPFYRRNKDRQVKVLSEYLVKEPGLSQTDTAEELEVDRETVKNIQEAWNQLSQAERIILIDFLRDSYVEQHSELDEETILPD